MSSIAYDYKETLLSIKGVSRKLGGKQILKNVNAEIKNIVRPGMSQGQVVGLLGPSGVGKTTLFRLIAGMDHPDEGSILLGEEQVPVEPGTVGVVAQHYPLFNHRTILSNLVVAGKMAGLSAADSEEKSRAIMKRFGIEGHEDKYPVQLSGGQRQRAAIAQQFMCSDFLLLLDEPFSGLDPLALDRLCQFILEVASSDEHKTLIIVTHDISAAVTVCDHLWLVGREETSPGEFVPGAFIKQEIDLIKRGLAWRTNIQNTPEFYATVNEIHELFTHL